jgi:hypothetical protein
LKRGGFFCVSEFINVWSLGCILGLYGTPSITYLSASDRLFPSADLTAKTQDRKQFVPYSNSVSHYGNLAVQVLCKYSCTDFGKKFETQFRISVEASACLRCAYLIAPFFCLYVYKNSRTGERIFIKFNAGEFLPRTVRAFMLFA